MTSTKTRIPLAKAEQLASALMAELLPGCERLEVAGSIRRKKPECGDVELVAIPRLQTDLFGSPTGKTFLDPILDHWIGEGRLERLQGGEKWKKFRVVRSRCCLDLFLVRAETWGVQFLIRTGPAEFSKRCVTERHKGGWLPDGWSVAGGRLWDEQRLAVHTAEEVDFFRAIGRAYVEPEARR